MELEHFSHYHPLIFFEDLENIDDVPCYGCLRQVSGPNYKCIDCLDVHLHKSCAELPRELRHPLHPQHPLILSLEEEEDCKLCEGCNGYHALGFIYTCSYCNFNLDSSCASLPLTIKAENHDHPLTLMRRSVSFTCDACGKQGKGMFYSCALCPFLVHLHCSSFPLTVKHIRHRHPLNLTNSLQLHQSDRRLCLLCIKYVDTNNMVYYCSTCDYVNHLHCAANEELLDETFEDTESIESIDSFNTYVVLKSNLGEPVEIKHFCHEHDLKLVDEQPENNEKCDGCMWPIFPPFYTCAQCSFFLHKSCVELPSKKFHPLHRHPLVLLPESPNRISSCFMCDACGRYCNGFTYYCSKCKFNLDVQCSLIPESINHEGHEHQLFLSTASYFDKLSGSYFEKCSSCDSEGQIFRCADCEFILDFKCATLQHNIRYGPHKQPFRVCYQDEDEDDSPFTVCNKDEDDSDDKYYCDICEEKRDPKQWFYYCRDLSFPAHADCILGRFPYIKFGRTYTYGIDKHPLTLVNKSKCVQYPRCAECGLLCDGLALECVKCDWNFHRECVW